MKKHSTLLTALLLLVATVAKPATEAYRGADKECTTMRIGYSDGNMALNLGLGGMAIIIQGAIQFPAEYMQKLKGNKITKLRLAIGDNLSEQDNYVFITNNLNAGTFNYKQKVDKLELGWNEITLDQPFDITGEEVYVGFRYYSSGTPLSFDGHKANSMGNWIRLLQKEDQADIAWNHQSGGCHNLQAVIEGNSLPQNDACIEEVVVQSYAQTGGKTPIRLVIRNMAAAEINSMEVTSTIEGKDPIIHNVSGLKIGSNEVALVEVGDITFAKNGIYDLDIQISKVNEMDDEYPADNNGVVKNVIAKKDYTHRTVLLEHFSTMNCTNCPSAHKTIEDAFMYRKDVVHVVHHAGMYTDPLTLPDSEKYFFFYQDATGKGSIYAPAGMLDRTNMAAYGATDNEVSTPGPVFFPQRDTFTKLLDQRLSTQALVTIGIESEYDPASRQLSVTVAGEVPSGDVAKLKGNDIRLNIVLTEDSIQCKDYPQAGASDGVNFYHNNTVRKMITDVWGDEIGFDNAAYRSKTYTFTVPGEWVDKQMRIVAFLSNLDKTNSSNSQVYNATETTLINNAASSISTVASANETVNVYATTDELFVKGDYRKAYIYNTSGQLVKAIAQAQDIINISTLPQGVFFIAMETEGGMQTCKFVKQ